MQVRIAPGVAPVLEEQADFRAFRVVAAMAPDHAALRAALGAAGVAEGDAHAWIAESWLRAASGLAESPEWLRGFRAMLDYAQARGWWRDGPSAIRAHVVWQPLA